MIKRLNEHKGMYALLIAVAAMIAITIYGSCSAEEDDDYYSDNELSTRAEREMRRGNEGNGTIIYPCAENIIDDNVILTKMREVWQETLNLATPTSRRECGFYIYWKYANKEFYPGEVVYGDPKTGTQRCTIKLGKYENENEVCGRFHTHPPLSTYPTDSHRHRSTGPSTEDIDAAYKSKMPGFVCDYACPEIYVFTPKDTTYQIYLYGPDRRIK